MNSEQKRVAAFRKFLQDDGEDIAADESPKGNLHDNCMLEWAGREYLVLTSREADKRAADYIKDSVWAFKPEFIASHSKLSHSATVKVCEALQDKCESANEDVKALIKNMRAFVKDAIAADGRGHFLSSYDGQEHEVRLGGRTYYIYRVN